MLNIKGLVCLQCQLVRNVNGMQLYHVDIWFTEWLHCNEILNPAWRSAQVMTGKRCTTFHVQRQPQEPCHPDGRHLTWGLPFGYGHPQKRNLYISEAVFVGKYRHVSDPWKSGVGVMNLLGHSVALWLRCGWAAFMACVNYVGLPTVGCDVETMLCLLLQDATHEILVQTWLNGRFHFFPCLCPVEVGSIGCLQIIGILERNGISVVEHNCRVEMFG